MNNFYDPANPPFFVGQQLVRKIHPRWGKPRYGAPFKVHIVEFQQGQWIVLDVHLNKFRASDCVDAVTYQSPLWESMQELE